MNIKQMQHIELIEAYTTRAIIVMRHEAPEDEIYKIGNEALDLKEEILLRMKGGF